MTRRAAKAVAIVAVIEIVVLCATVCIHARDAAKPPYTLPEAYREYWAGLDAATLSTVAGSIQEEISDLCDMMRARVDDLVYIQGLLATDLPPP